MSFGGIGFITGSNILLVSYANSGVKEGFGQSETGTITNVLRRRLVVQTPDTEMAAGFIARPQGLLGSNEALRHHSASLSPVPSVSKYSAVGNSKLLVFT